DNGILIIQRTHQRRNRARISKIPQRYRGVAAQALPFGALDGAVAEALLVRCLVDVQQLNEVWKGDVFAWCKLLVDSLPDQRVMRAHVLAHVTAEDPGLHQRPQLAGNPPAQLDGEV